MKKNLPHFEEIVYNIKQTTQGQAKICAVGKTVSAELIQEAIDSGINDIGENRVQEAAAKFPLIKGGCRHLIGPLQRNKENNALALFDVIQSLENIEQCQRLCTKLENLEIRKCFYIQVNTSEEEQKHGVCDLSTAFKMADILLNCPFASFEGLMTIGSLTKDPRPSFSNLRDIRDRMQQEFGLSLGLSMGMSNDYDIALQEGATLVRLGSLLFGKRS